MPFRCYNIYAPARGNFHIFLFVIDAQFQRWIYDFPSDSVVSRWFMWSLWLSSLTLCLRWWALSIDCYSAVQIISLNCCPFTAPLTIIKLCYILHGNEYMELATNLNTYMKWWVLISNRIILMYNINKLAWTFSILKFRTYFRLFQQFLNDIVFFQVKLRAMELAKKIENEDGVAAAVDAFHRHLPPELPLPTASFDDTDENNPFLWLLLLIEKWCCLPCAS